MCRFQLIDQLTRWISYHCPHCETQIITNKPKEHFCECGHIMPKDILRKIEN